MNTDDLVSMLAAGVDPVDPRVTVRRYAEAIGAGALGALVTMALVLGVRPDIAQAATLPMFWGKVAFVACLAAASVAAAMRLSRPGVSVGRAAAWITAPVLAVWGLAIWVMLRAGPAERSTLLFGDTWNTCPLNLAMLSAPVFIALLWAMKGLAPTRLALAGAAAGLAAGSIGAVVYCLHCPETAAPFLAVWYVLGMLIPAALGAVLGPRLLRW